VSTSGGKRPQVLDQFPHRVLGVVFQRAALEQAQFLVVVLGRAVSGGAFVCARPYG
jgi:hypothetical protein